MALIEHYIALYDEYKRILTERQFEVMWLKEIEGLSGKEVAAKLGDQPVSSVAPFPSRNERNSQNSEKRNRWAEIGPGQLTSWITSPKSGA